LKKKPKRKRKRKRDRERRESVHDIFSFSMLVVEKERINTFFLFTRLDIELKN
jgi:hypothetical protein